MKKRKSTQSKEREENHPAKRKFSTNSLFRLSISECAFCRFRCVGFFLFCVHFCWKSSELCDCWEEIGCLTERNGDLRIATTSSVNGLSRRRQRVTSLEDSTGWEKFVWKLCFSIVVLLTDFLDFMLFN